jgi:hypothetical protein
MCDGFRSVSVMERSYFFTSSANLSFYHFFFFEKYRTDREDGEVKGGNSLLLIRPSGAEISKSWHWKR